MKYDRIYCVGPFNNIGPITYGNETFSIQDYLTKLEFIVKVEPKEVYIEKKECILEHIDNLKETPILIFDGTENCEFNVPWDIGYLSATISKKIKNKILIVLKFGAIKNEKKRWRMEHSFLDLRENLALYEPKNETELKIVLRNIRNPSAGISKKFWTLFSEAAQKVPVFKFSKDE